MDNQNDKSINNTIKKFPNYLSDKELADILKVDVHSGTECEIKWENKLLECLINNKTDYEHIWKVYKKPYTYIGGRWLHHHIQDFFQKHPQYTILPDKPFLEGK